MSSVGPKSDNTDNYNIEQFRLPKVANGKIQWVDASNTKGKTAATIASVQALLQKLPLEVTPDDLSRLHTELKGLEGKVVEHAKNHLGRWAIFGGIAKSIAESTVKGKFKKILKEVDSARKATKTRLRLGRTDYTLRAQTDRLAVQYKSGQGTSQTIFATLSFKGPDQFCSFTLNDRKYEIPFNENDSKEFLENFHKTRLVHDFFGGKFPEYSDAQRKAHFEKHEPFIYQKPDKPTIFQVDFRQLVGGRGYRTADCTIEEDPKGDYTCTFPAPNLTGKSKGEITFNFSNFEDFKKEFLTVTGDQSAYGRTPEERYNAL